MDSNLLSQTIKNLHVSSGGEKLLPFIPTSDGKHAFWSTQPMRKPEERPETGGPIEPDDKDIRQEPYNLPAGFVWCTCDVFDETIMRDVYTLLNENYVEDDDNMFRFDYSVPFLRWALTPPHYKAEWHVGVRTEKSGKLVGFITGIPATMRAWDQPFSSVEINFLCVHKKLRSKRLAPVLIKEVTRRVNCAGIFQAVYTAGAVLPTPVASCRYWHRSLNPKKLIEVGFSRLQPRMTMARTLKLYKLPEEIQLQGLRPIQKQDVPSVCRLLTAHLNKFKLASLFTEAEVEHWFLTQEGVVYCYVKEDPATREISDMLSFYVLPSTIIGNKQYPTLKAAYSFYNVATSVPFVQLMSEALIIAKQLDFDVFNALNILDNDEEILKELKFGIGDGRLQYYLYNWRCKDMQPSDVGLVLL
uniref:Glycylpeptide N-tetradecanoyltransferase n=1 Tax=Guillardia theta TaxID=55529 RepID=A0A7S4K4H0_GUITH